MLLLESLTLAFAQVVGLFGPATFLSLLSAHHITKADHRSRSVVPGGAGGPWHPQILADQSTLSQPGGGADYAHHITTAPPPDFQTFRHPCRTSSNHFPFRSNGLFYSSDLFLDAFCLILTHSDALTHPPPKKRWS